MKQLKVGSKVHWRWMGGVVEGRVEKVYFKPTTRTIKGKVIKRNGNKDKPAYLVKSAKGGLALKLQSELSPRKKTAPPPIRMELQNPVHTEFDVIKDLSEDFGEAYGKLTAEASLFGEQRVYASEKAVMFARRICYMFVRPKTKYLELVFFLPREIKSPAIYRVDERSKTKFAHTVRLVHTDQVESPLTDWLKEAYKSSV